MTMKTLFTQNPQILCVTPTIVLHPDCPIDMLRDWAEQMWDDDEIRWVLSEPLNAFAEMSFAEPLHAAITYATWCQYIIRVE